MANTTTKVDLVINRMSQSKYEQLKSAGQLDPNQIYMTTDGIDPVPDTRKVNGQTLEADVVLTGADIAVSTSDSTKIDAALAGKADDTDVVLTQQLGWVCDPATLSNGSYDVGVVPASGTGAWQFAVKPSSGSGSWLAVGTPTGTSTSTSLSQTVSSLPDGTTRTLTATLTVIPGYILGSQTNKPLASSTHTHGNITNAGALQAIDIAIANGDKLVVTDASDSNKVARTSLAFDGSTTTQYLSKKGTWQSLPTASTSASGVVQLNDTLTSTSTTQAATANAVKQLNDKFEDYVSLADLEDGLEVDDIEAKSITVDGVKPSLEGHTHTTDDITDFPSLVGQTMPTNPTQNELTAAVKKIWEALGGSYE